MLFFGYDFVKVTKANKTIKSKDLTLYETKTGNFYLPTEAKSDVVAQAMINNEVFEKEVVDIAKKYIQPGTAILDVGSNFGQMTVLFSKHVGEQGKVFAFDADDFVFDVLKKNIAANNCKNVIPTFGAVHNKADEILLFPEQDFVEFQTYGSYGIDYTATNGRKVKSLTIDSLNITEKISFMKIDIQGGDLQAMQGAIATINKNQMPIIFEYEYHYEEKFKMNFQQYVDFVASINYKFERVINGHNYLILPK